jgi:hypothetical protein
VHALIDQYMSRIGEQDQDDGEDKSQHGMSVSKVSGPLHCLTLELEQGCDDIDMSNVFGR